MRKGFTLIELLAVIIIMGIVFAIVSASISNVVDRVADEEYDILRNVIEEAAELYIDNYQPTELDVVGGNYCVTLQNLIDEGLVEEPIIDPRDDSEYASTTCTYVERTGTNQYLYEFDSTLTDLRLMLVGNNPATVSCATSGNYTDPGADVYDINNLPAANVYSLTVLPLQDAGTYSLGYSYTDGAGITITKNRSVIITNAYMPTITVNGGLTTLAVALGSAFSPPAATATDTCEGSLDVTVTSNVIPTVAGNYTVIYTVTNKGGNTKTVTIDVTVA